MFSLPSYFQRWAERTLKILPAWFRGQFASGPRANVPSCYPLSGSLMGKVVSSGEIWCGGAEFLLPLRSFVVTLHGRDSKVQQTLQEQQPSHAWNWTQLLQWESKDTWLGVRTLVLICLVGTHAQSPCFTLGSAQEKSQGSHLHV